MRVLLTALFVLVVLTLGLALTALSYNRIKDASLAEARSLFDRTSNSVAQSIVQNRLEIGYALAVAAGSPLAAAPTFAQRFGAKDTLLGLLRSNPLVTNAYVGYPDGEFLLLRHVEATDPIPAQMRASTAFLLRSVQRTGGAIDARSQFYDTHLHLRLVRDEPRFRFDPRTRSWFSNATQSVSVSAPYLLFGRNRMGVTLTKGSAARSVFGADIDLETLSQELERLRPTPSSVAALVTPNGVVLAYSNPRRLLDVNSANRVRPATVDELSSPPISAAFAAAPAHDIDFRGTYRDQRGSAWLFGVLPGRDAQGRITGYRTAPQSLSRLLIIAIPEDELLGTALRVRNESLLLCLALVVTMVPLAYFLSQLVANPLGGLRSDALSLRNLDFSERPSHKSVITEIGEFSDTFGAMRSHIREHNQAATNFVPREFLELLGRRDLRSLELGDHTERVMTMLFSDIRAFTTLSGTMTPEETFNFVNSYLKQIGPIIREHRGFIDKYIGDAIFALFPHGAADGINTAIAMQRKLVTYNEGRARAGYAPVAIGIGVHHGGLMLGTIGEERRFETTVISDAVNIAARIEGLTKNFGALILTSGDAVRDIDRSQYMLRPLGDVLVKGATHSVAIYELCDADPPELFEHKMRTRELFETGRLAYVRGDFVEAQRIFTEIAAVGTDRPAVYFRDRAAFMASALDVIEWDGVEHMEAK